MLKNENLLTEPSICNSVFILIEYGSNIRRKFDRQTYISRERERERERDSDESQRARKREKKDRPSSG